MRLPRQGTCPPTFVDCDADLFDLIHRTPVCTFIVAGVAYARSPCRIMDEYPEIS
jgi:hypothetical protein